MIFTNTLQCHGLWCFSQAVFLQFPLLTNLQSGNSLLVSQALWARAFHGHLPGVSVKSPLGPAGGRDSLGVAPLLAAHPTAVTHLLPY